MSHEDTRLLDDSGLLWLTTEDETDYLIEDGFGTLGHGDGAEAAATASGSGAIAYAGTGAGTQAVQTASGTGTVESDITGTGAGVQPRQTGSGSGLVFGEAFIGVYSNVRFKRHVRGTGQGTGEPPEASGVGHLAVSGRGKARQDRPSASGTAHARIAGTGAGSSRVSGAGEGVARLAGLGEGTEQARSSRGSGRLRVIAGGGSIQARSDGAGAGRWNDDELIWLMEEAA